MASEASAPPAPDGSSTRSARGGSGPPVMLIVAELLHTLRFVVLRGTIIVEPFLFVGLIAVVRRVLIVTAELENNAPAGRALTNQLLPLGLLGFLALALAVAIFLVRRGGPAGYDPAQGSV
jgi:Phosphate-starvation-inducible E family